MLRLLDRIIPDELRGEDRTESVIILTFAAAGILGFSITALAAELLGIQAHIWIALVTVGLLLLAPVLLRLTRRPSWAGHHVGCVVYLALGGLSATLGYLEAAFAMWLVVIPLGAALLQRTGEVIVWTVLALIQVAALHLLESMGALGPPVALPPGVIVANLLSMVVVIVVIARVAQVQRERARQDSRLLEQRLIEARRMEALARFSGGISHDFNNLLTVIVAGTDLARRDDTLSEQTRADLEMIAEAAERGAKLSRRLLSLSNPELGGAERFELNAMLREEVTLLRRLVRDDIVITFEPHDAELVVRIRQSDLQRVLLNMVLNAQEAMPEGGELALSTKMAPTDAAATDHGLGFACLSVSDTGKGMSEEVLSRIFEPLFTTAMVGGGTGLGLFTAYQTVRAVGGDVRATSTPGAGSRFDVVLPLVAGGQKAVAGAASVAGAESGAESGSESESGSGAESGSGSGSGSESVAASASESVAASESESGSGSGSESGSGSGAESGSGSGSGSGLGTTGSAEGCAAAARRGLQALVVDDEPGVLKVAERVLLSEGYGVQIAHSGDQALEIFDAAGGGISLVLSDVLMPGMSGVDLTRALRARQPDLPILLMSGYTDDVVAPGLLQELNVGLLKKPFARRGLMKALQERQR